MVTPMLPPTSGSPSFESISRELLSRKSKRSSLNSYASAYSALHLALARENAAYLGAYTLGLVPTRFHVEWQELCSAYDRLILFGPIDHGKSQQLSVLRPLWELGENPNQSIALISETATMAVKWLGRIKANIESNPYLQEVYPKLQPSVRRGRWEHWHHNSILVEWDQYFSWREKDFSIEALGVGGAMMGARFDIALLDDCITRRNALTPGGRANVRGWIKDTLLGRMKPGGRVWMTNNAWHVDDAGHVFEREESEVWKVVRYAAGEGVCVWPERWPQARLEAKLLELGELEYARQLLNIALSDSTGLLPLEAARDCQAKCDDPPGWWGGEHSSEDFRYVVAGLDLGGTDKVTGSPSAVAVVGIGKRDNLKHLAHMRTGNWLGIELLRQIVDVQRAHRPREWVVETNAVQLHLASMIRDPELMRAAGATQEEARSIRVFGQYTTAQAKTEATWGIRGMGNDLDARRWRFPQGQREVAELLRSIGSYSLASHTGDRLIALWLADLRLRGYAGIFALKATSR